MAKVAVQCSVDTLVVNQSLVLRINIYGENHHLRQARNRWASLMNWEEIHKTIYYWDGSWRDIYLFNSSRQEWTLLLQLLNSDYEIEWHNPKTDETCSKIDVEQIAEFWDGNDELISTAKIFLDDLQINFHFFTEEEIEADLDPREFKKQEDHQKLLGFLSNISKHLNKEVFVIPENAPEYKLIRVNQETIDYDLSNNPSEWPVRIKE